LDISDSDCDKKRATYCDKSHPIFERYQSMSQKGPFMKHLTKGNLGRAGTGRAGRRSTESEKAAAGGASDTQHC
jgi:hypothetical protein